MSQERAGFFASPPSVVTRIVKLIKPLSQAQLQDGGLSFRALDPCCGYGAALHQVAGALSLFSYGVELNRERADGAKRVLTQALYLDYRLMRSVDEAYSLLYLNPPYDYDMESGRLEYAWLKETTKFLTQNGLLVFVVPRSILSHERVRRYLSDNYENLTAYRFQDPEYAIFKQIVIFGNRRKPSPDQDTEHWLYSLLDSNMDELPESGPAIFPLIGVKDKVTFYFRSKDIPLDDLLDEANAGGVATTQAWRDLMTPRQANTALRPVMPLKHGHLSQVIAAGMMNNLPLSDGDTSIIIKGQSFKTKKVVDDETRELTSEESASRDYGRENRVRTIVSRETLTTQVHTLDLTTGDVVNLEGDALTMFFEKWGPKLGEYVAQTYPPIYGFDYSKYAPVLNSLSMTRPVPGLTGKFGMLEVQKHCAAGVYEALQESDGVFLVGEMGVGKSLVSVAVAALLKIKRGVIICPAHLLPKWEREVKIAWPQCHVVFLRSMTDVDRFFSSAMPTPCIAIVGKETAKLGPGWRHATVRMNKLKESGNYRNRKKVKYLAHICPKCGEEVKDKDGNIVTDDYFPKNTQRKCFTCGEPLWEFRPKDKEESESGPKNKKDKLALLLKDAGMNGLGRLNWLTANGEFANNHLYLDVMHNDDGRGHRWPLADYIMRYYRGQLDLCIADEVQKFKDPTADQSTAFANLVMASKKTVCLTGTIYGGRASSIFSLLYRMSNTFKKRFTFTDVGKWVEQFGLLEEIQKQEVTKYGYTTGSKRSNIRVREIPGCSPAMAPFLLDRSVFVALADLGFALPEYTEIPCPIDMESDMAEKYADFEDELKTALKKQLCKGSKRLLGAYLQSLLAWPDAPYRDEVVRDSKTGEVVASIKGLDNHRDFPKEEWLMARISEEIQAGRRTCVYTPHTDTRDITGRLKEIAEKAGARAVVLKSTVDPEKREAWIDNVVAGGAEVLICNPKLVETGLDLVAFSTAVFFGTEYSTYTLRQASRRFYRIGQTQPVNIYFPVYMETMQEKALKLVAQKIRAALRVEGFSLDTGLANAADEGSVFDALLGIIETGTDNLPGLQELFASASQSERQAEAYLLQSPKPESMIDVSFTQVPVPVMQHILEPLPVTGLSQLKLFGF